MQTIPIINIIYFCFKSLQSQSQSQSQKIVEVDFLVSSHLNRSATLILQNASEHGDSSAIFEEGTRHEGATAIDRHSASWTVNDSGIVLSKRDIDEPIPVIERGQRMIEGARICS